MKFPSVQTLVQSTLAVCKRFPLTILFVLISCFCSLMQAHNWYLFEYQDSRYQAAHYYYFNVIWSSYLGMLLSLIVYIYAERNKVSIVKKWIGLLCTVVLVVIFYFSLPDYFSEGRFIQFVLFMVGLHLMVAFIPFTGKNELNGFWQYNKTLFLRVLSAALYSIVLYLGLALALLAVEKLFSVNLNYKWYTDLWICTFELFASLFFLSGFPSAFETLESNRDYPKGLKVFTQYILLPIITVYLFILYAYMFKIIATLHWPFGWVSYLVLAFATAGILSILLIYPIRMEANNKWILSFSRFFYFAICPLIILLFLAIERRISDYGITEERYIVFGLSCWLGFISLYFLISKARNIKAIPVSLCILALGISFGPWGIFSVSLNSQKDRLIKSLRANGMLNPDQKIIPSKNRIAEKDTRQISSIVKYLVEAHGYRSLQPLFSQNLDSILKIGTVFSKTNTYGQSTRILSLMKVETNGEYNSESYFQINSRFSDSLIGVSGYEYLLNELEIKTNNGEEDGIHKIISGGHSLTISFDKNSGLLTLKMPSDSTIHFDINRLVRTLKNNNFVDDENDNRAYKTDSLILSGENKELSTKILIQNINGMGNAEKIEIDDITLDILLHYKK
jgi:hypothetical protein